MDIIFDHTSLGDVSSSMNVDLLPHSCAVALLCVGYDVVVAGGGTTSLHDVTIVLVAPHCDGEGEAKGEEQ